MNRTLYIIYLFFNGRTDREVKSILDKPIDKIDRTTKSIQKVNRLFCSKSITYKIAKATGSKL